jgi:hypothetical protein
MNPDRPHESLLGYPPGRTVHSIAMTQPAIPNSWGPPTLAHSQPMPNVHSSHTYASLMPCQPLSGAIYQPSRMHQQAWPIYPTGPPGWHPRSSPSHQPIYRFYASNNLQATLPVELTDPVEQADQPARTAPNPDGGSSWPMPISPYHCPEPNDPPPYPHGPEGYGHGQSTGDMFSAKFLHDTIPNVDITTSLEGNGQKLLFAEIVHRYMKSDAVPQHLLEDIVRQKIGPYATRVWYDKYLMSQPRAPFLDAFKNRWLRLMDCDDYNRMI